MEPFSITKPFEYLLKIDISWVIYDYSYFQLDLRVSYWLPRASVFISLNLWKTSILKKKFGYCIEGCISLINNNFQFKFTFSLKFFKITLVDILYSITIVFSSLVRTYLYSISILQIVSQITHINIMEVNSVNCVPDDHTELSSIFFFCLLNSR